MSFLRIALLSLALLPGTALAAVSAGFAPAPVWLSTSAPVEGVRVEVYTTVVNASDEGIEGSLAFLADGAEIGATPFSLRAGESEVLSVRWTPEEGRHALAARIDTAVYAQSKRAADIAPASTDPVSVTVAAREEDEEEKDEREESPVAKAAGTLASSPIAGPAIAAATQAGEGLRESVARFLASQASSTAPSVAEEDGAVLGVATSTIPEKAKAVAAAAAGAALPLASYPALFYPLVLILVLGILWLLMRRLRNPPRRKRR